MNQSIFLECYALTDVGRVRSQNEDSVVVRPDIGVVVLADGMGGYQAGEVASQLATETTIASLVVAFDQIDPADTGSNVLVASVLVRAIQDANCKVFGAAEQQPSLKGMGTTLVASLFNDEMLFVAHVGDSRAYRLRAGVQEQITKDHSEVQMLVDVGLLSPEEARHAPNKNLITRALGIGECVDVEVSDFVTQPNDLYLLCSDGLTDMLDDRTILGVIDTTGQSLQRIAQALIDLANQAGGLDNVSVILIRVAVSEPENLGFFKNVRNWVKRFE